MSHEQLAFVTGIILGAAMDRIEGEDDGQNLYAQGALECAGMALSALYYQVTGEPMGILDALEVAGGFEEAALSGKPVDLPQHVAAFVGAVKEASESRT
jgi:hypothetical protein